MQGRQERLLVYTALVMVCGALAALAGWSAALWTLLQLVCLLEIFSRLARLAMTADADDINYRAWGR